MDFLSTSDILLLKLGLAGASLGLAKSYGSRLLRPAKATPPDFPLLRAGKSANIDALPATRSIRKRLDQTGKECVIFYGSQTGTAEKLAFRLAKQAGLKYGLNSLVADLNDYDYDDLQKLSDTKLVVFLLATYGEGEPTDNAISFNNFVKAADGQEGITSRFQGLRYSAFGLGNSSYQFYNSMVLQTDERMRSSGATRVGQVGLGDDGLGTLEDDFNEWADATLPQIATIFGLGELDQKYRPMFEISETEPSNGPKVFLGEPNNAHLNGKIRGPFTAQNPFPARVVEARELFNSPDRHCLHMEFDVSGSTVSYDTGDHLSVLPMNAEVEVDRLLRVLGLFDRRHNTVAIRTLDSTVPVPVPTTTTYDSLFRYYLDIGSQVSRRALAEIADFTFEDQVTKKRLNLGQLLSTIGEESAFASIPFSYILENIPKLQPRYYSISSSSLASKKQISVTAVVDSLKVPDTGFDFNGVSTSYLLALKSKFSANGEQSKNGSQTHQIRGPRARFSEPTALINVRRSKFRLPRATVTPVIMIGPGTGVAPFRAFVQERAYQSQAGKEIGRQILFYGCRRRDEDYIYEQEWEHQKSVFGEEKFSIYTAFSRESDKKVYVQDLLREHASELRELVLRQNAHVYVCGDASSMAKGVFKSFASIISNGSDEDGEAYLTAMKSAGRWSEDVW